METYNAIKNCCWETAKAYFTKASVFVCLVIVLALFFCLFEVVCQSFFLNALTFSNNHESVFMSVFEKLFKSPRPRTRHSGRTQPLSGTGGIETDSRTVTREAEGGTTTNTNGGGEEGGNDSNPHCVLVYKNNGTEKIYKIDKGSIFIVPFTPPERHGQMHLRRQEFFNYSDDLPPPYDDSIVQPHYPSVNDQLDLEATESITQNIR